MEDEGYSFKFNAAAKKFLAQEGYDAAYGARPLKRAIQKYVEDLIADAIINGDIEAGNTYTITKIKSEDKLSLK